MSISTFNFQFYNYKMPAAMGCSTSHSSSSFISELEMDIDEEMSSPSVTSTPKPRITTELALQLQHDSSTPAAVPAKTTLPCLRPQLHTAQKRWSMELREKVLEMSKRNNGSDGEDQPQTTEQEHPLLQLQEKAEQQTVNVDVDVDVNPIVTPTVTDKINFFNKLTNTFESTRSGATTGTANGISSKCNNNNRFISLLRSTRPQGIATTSSSNNSSLSGISVLSQVPPPKPKRLMATASPSTTFAMPSSMGMSSQRKCSLRRKPSMDKSRATISRQNSSASVRPQHHAIMEDLSLVVPVRLRIAEYEQRISMSA
ncbi:protein bottleneck [Drosophila guanche]|uniref:Blast:Protein bottleneck n=1 Tax=Drosophila guanche TaxID=7266 RepID=A0A3B0JFC4_DROGU|nr:protein bottleneck [Drosophila guanche]SPP80825.1 blast:Protein bottleneck [Drosophila guanche]